MEFPPDEHGAWIPASAGPADRYGRVLGHDGRGWTLVVTNDLETAEIVGGFLASEDAEQYLVGKE